jgi:hypothetical protein
VDPLELTRVELWGVHAVDKRTQTVNLYDLRIRGFKYIEKLPSRSDLLRIVREHYGYVLV